MMAVAIQKNLVQVASVDAKLAIVFIDFFFFSSSSTPSAFHPIFCQAQFKLAIAVAIELIWPYF